MASPHIRGLFSFRWERAPETPMQKATERLATGHSPGALDELPRGPSRKSGLHLSGFGIGRSTDEPGPDELPSSAKPSEVRRNGASPPPVGRGQALGLTGPSFLTPDGKTLDMSGISAVIASRILPTLTPSERRGIVTLKLPAGLRALPDWTPTLPSLKRLEIGHFAGWDLDIRAPQIEEVHIAGGNVRLVRVPARARVYCRDGYGTHPEKIVVRFRDPTSGKVVREDAAIGHTYFVPNAEGKLNAGNLNDQAQFEEQHRHLSYYDPISCRHLATDWLYKIQHFRARRLAGRFVDWWGRQKSSKEAITASVSPDTEARFHELCRCNPETALVGQSRWGTFLREEYATLKLGARKHFLVTTPAHVMSMEIAKERTPDGQRYVATLYDPNYTATYKQITEDNLDRVASWQLLHFMPAVLIPEHYGDGNSPAITLFAPLPADAHRKPMSQPLFDPQPDSRELREFLTDADRASPQAMLQRFASAHVTADTLRQTLALCRTPAEKLALLSPATARGEPCLYIALQCGDVQAIQAVHVIAKELLEAGEMTDAEFVDLLEARSQIGNPGLVWAYDRNHWAAVLAFGEMVAYGISTGRLNPERAAHVLEEPLPNDAPAFFIPLQNGQVDIIRAVGDLLDHPVISNALSPEQCANWLAAKLPDGTPGFHATHQQNEAEAARAYGAVVARARSREQLTDEQVFTLLEARHPDGCTGLAASLRAGGVETIQAVGELLGDPVISRSLTNDRVARILTPEIAPGTSVFRLEDTSLRPNAVEAFKQITRDAHARGQLTDAQAATILGTIPPAP